MTRARTRSVVLPRIALLALVIAVGYLVLLPLYRLQHEALAEGGAGYEAAFTAPRVGRTIRYTIALAFGSLAIAMVLGTLLAWAATRLPRRLGFLRVVPILPIVVPAIASVIGWAFLLSPRPGYINVALRKLPWWSDLDQGPINVFTVPWIIIVTGISLTSFVYLFVSAGFAQISGDHIEAAQVAGSGSWGVFFKVILPLLRPSLTYGGGVALLLGLGQFTAPLLLGRNGGIDVVTTDMYRAMANYPPQYGRAAALGSTLLLFGLIVVFAQRVLLGDHRRFVTHGGKAFRPERTRSWLAAIGLVAYSTVATVLPLGALAIVSLSKFWTADIDVSSFVLDNYRDLFDQATITDGIKNSIVISLIAVAICLPLGFVIANVLLRGSRFRILRATLDVIVALPLGIPAVVFGVGFLMAYTQGPVVLYGTRWVIVLVYVTLMLPFTTRMQLSALVSFGNSYVEAARVSGSGLIAANVKVVVPMMRSTLGGAAALMFVLLTHEFAASMLVRSSTTQVMGTVLYNTWSSGSYPLVAAIALVMTAVTAVGVLVAVLLAGSDVLSRL